MCILYVYLSLWLWMTLTVSVRVFKEVCLFKNRILATHHMHYFCSGTHWYSAHCTLVQWHGLFLKPNWNTISKHTHTDTRHHVTFIIKMKPKIVCFIRSTVLTLSQIIISQTNLLIKWCGTILLFLLKWNFENLISLSFGGRNRRLFEYGR